MEEEWAQTCGGLQAGFPAGAGVEAVERRFVAPLTMLVQIDTSGRVAPLNAFIDSDSPSAKPASSSPDHEALTSRQSFHAMAIGRAVRLRVPYSQRERQRGLSAEQS
jgi:hypothetical protein